MATENSNPIPRGLRLRGKTWHISRVVAGKQIRMTTGCSDLENALQVYKALENHHVVGALDEWWQEQIRIAADLGSKRSWIMKALYRARSRPNVKADITREEILILANKCGGKCSVTGLRFSGAVFGRRRPFVPSLDRIDCQKGYTLTNCRFVCLITNYAMSDFGEQAFRILANAFVAKELLEKTAQTLTQDWQ